MPARKAPISPARLVEMQAAIKAAPLGSKQRRHQRRAYQRALIAMRDIGRQQADGRMRTGQVGGGKDRRDAGPSVPMNRPSPPSQDNPNFDRRVRHG